MNNIIEIRLHEDDKAEIVQRVVEELKATLQPQSKEEMIDLEGIKLYTREEVMKFLNISSSTLWHLVKDGKLNQIKYGGRVAFRESELKDFINRNTVKGND